MELHKKSLASPELIETMVGTAGCAASIIGIRSVTQLTAPIIDECKSLKAIGCYSIGVDGVDLKAAARRGIPVFNSPFSSTRSVAELIIAQIINLSRGIGDNICNMKANKWEKVSDNKFEIRGRTLGILGYGHIGSVLSILAEGMGMKTIFYDIVPKLAYGNAKQVASLAECLSQANFVTLHVPGGSSTANMINASTIALMKPGSYLLNASRGTVVVIADVVDALKRKHLSGFYADVFPFEPKMNGDWLPLGAWEGKESKMDVIDSLAELRSLPNVMLTSHIGGSSEQGQKAIAEDVSTKLLNFFSAGSTLGAVNLPQLSLPLPIRGGVSSTSDAKPYYRICNFHKNVPGVLRDINYCLEKFNIVQQTLSTMEDIGYCIVDVERLLPGEEYEKEFAIAREKISLLPSTIALTTFTF